MDRSLTRRELLAAGALGLAGCSSSPPDGDSTIGLSEGFEEGFAGWETGADVPEDPNDPGSPVEWHVERSTERAASGSASLRLFLDGRQDDGTIWVRRSLEVERGRAYGASVRAEAWSPSESFNTIAHLVIYLGSSPPRDEESFPPPGESGGMAGGTSGGLREPLNQSEGWRPYSFSWTTPALDAERLYLAVGISAVWETEMTYFVDDVKATLVPA